MGKLQRVWWFVPPSGIPWIYRTRRALREHRRQSATARTYKVG